MDFKPEILPVKDLQILKPVLWGDLTYDENIPTMSFYEDVQKISPHPLQYDVITYFFNYNYLSNFRFSIPIGPFENESVSFATYYVV